MPDECLGATYDVSIHAPAKGATCASLPDTLSESPCFNSRAREGRDVRYAKVANEIGVSIHALAKGATIITFHILFPGSVSIHAPAKGATYHYDTREIMTNVSIHAPAKGATSAKQVTAAILAFQFTRPRRARLVENGSIVFQKDVSIHAPAKGATVSNNFNYVLNGGVSIHAPAKGATSEIMARLKH